MCGDTLRLTGQTDSLSQHLWTFNGLLLPGDQVTLPVYAAGFYPLVLRSTDSAGCWSESQAVVQVSNCPTVYIPNSFSPNNDGLNDYFGPVGVNIEILEFLVWNRWGQLIHDSPDGWDGKYKGKPVEIDLYVYRLTLIADGKREEITGKVSVVR